MTLPPPPTVITSRREPVHPPAHYTAWAGGTAPGIPVDVQWQERPLPPEPTKFWGVGRTYDHAWSHIRVQQQVALNQWAYPSGMAPHFLPGMKSNPGSLVTFQAVGGQNPIGSRVTINSPGQSKLSDQLQLAAPYALSANLGANYIKLA